MKRAGVNQLVKQETGIGKVDFTDITDYAVLLVYLIRCPGFTKTECKQLIAGYENVLERYRSTLPFGVYSMIVRTDARNKLATCRAM